MSILDKVFQMSFTVNHLNFVDDDDDDDSDNNDVIVT